MGSHWRDCKQYQLQTGKWVPKAHVYEDVGGELKATPVLAPADKVCDAEEEARTYSDAMARKWLRDRFAAAPAPVTFQAEGRTTPAHIAFDPSRRRAERSLEGALEKRLDAVSRSSSDKGAQQSSIPRLLSGGEAASPDGQRSRERLPRSRRPSR